MYSPDMIKLAPIAKQDFLKRSVKKNLKKILHNFKS